MDGLIMNVKMKNRYNGNFKDLEEKYYEKHLDNHECLEIESENGSKLILEKGILFDSEIKPSTIYLDNLSLISLKTKSGDIGKIHKIESKPCTELVLKIANGIILETKDIIPHIKNSTITESTNFFLGKKFTVDTNIFLKIDKKRPTVTLEVLEYLPKEKVVYCTEKTKIIILDENFRQIKSKIKIDKEKMRTRDALLEKRIEQQNQSKIPKAKEPYKRFLKLNLNFKDEIENIKKVNVSEKDTQEYISFILPIVKQVKDNAYKLGELTTLINLTTNKSKITVQLDFTDEKVSIIIRDINSNYRSILTTEI